MTDAEFWKWVEIEARAADRKAVEDADFDNTAYVTYQRDYARRLRSLRGVMEACDTLISETEGLWSRFLQEYACSRDDTTNEPINKATKALRAFRGE